MVNWICIGHFISININFEKLEKLKGLVNLNEEQKNISKYL